MGYLIMFIGLATLLVGIGWLFVSLFTKKPRNAFIVAVVGMVVLVIGIMVAPEENDTKADKPKTEKVDKKAQESSKKKEASESSVQKDNEKLAMDDFNSYLASKDYGSARVDSTGMIVVTVSDSIMQQPIEQGKVILRGIQESFNNYCEGNEWEYGENSGMEFVNQDGITVAKTSITGKIKLANE